MADVVKLRSGEREYDVQLKGDGALIDGTPVTPPAHALAVAQGDKRWVFLDGEVYEFEIQSQGRRRATGHHSSLSAPMPATVIRINVEPGGQVKKGDTLLVLEAMKMELPVRAPSDGVVASVACKVGDLVQPGASLIELGAS